MIFKIAFRSIFRNTRRSLMTISTVTVGTVAALVFGAYVVYIMLGLQTGTVRGGGHLTVYHSGYFLYGAGNPSAYGIDGYEALLKLIREDPVIQPRLAVATPIQAIAGIAGNFANDTSKPFFGLGFVPSDRDKMRQWDVYKFGTPTEGLGLSDADLSRGVIGTGLGRILGFCETLKIENCPPPPVIQQQASAVTAEKTPDFLADLAQRDRPQGASASAATEPRIDLLAATVGGAPNIVTLSIAKTAAQGIKEMDDGYVGMNLKLAQQLLYGRGAKKVTGVVLQLHRTEDTDFVRQRLASLFGERHLDLEVRDYEELNPYFVQVIAFMSSILLFIAVIIGIVVLFTVTNTVGMSVAERTAEIGTTRAMGLRRWGIRWQFVAEGWLLGLIGTTVGVALAALIVFAVNHSGLTWLPPGQARATPLRMDLFTRKSLVIATWLGLMAVATLSAYWPANRAAKLPIVDALRHV
jgi:putative ABC transport system permease protein